MTVKRAIREAIETLTKDLNAGISRGIKELLENKHLYQTVCLTLGDLVKSTHHMRGVIYVEDVQDVEKELSRRINADWTASEGAGALLFMCLDVKLVCATCDRLEAFNFVDVQSLLADGFRDNSQAVQVFAISFICQACKSIPEVFIVRRIGLRLTLCGRAPIEHIEVPNFIPNRVRPLYRKAILAFQSDQSLVGNFMLRTVIEQWARKETHSETSTKADKVLDAYMNTLPNDFKACFPSMRDLYADLSSDIHGAIGSSELFDRARTEIAGHFNALRIIKRV